jgi:hypothetical protein
MKQITCPFCCDTYPDFDVAHVCSRGPYAPKLKSNMNDESHLPVSEQSLVFRLRKRAEIRRQIQDRKSVQENKPDRIADLLEEAANEIEKLNGKLAIVDDYIRFK